MRALIKLALLALEAFLNRLPKAKPKPSAKSEALEALRLKQQARRLRPQNDNHGF